jgi:hypothetical protein
VAGAGGEEGEKEQKTPHIAHLVLYFVFYSALLLLRLLNVQLCRRKLQKLNGAYM